MFYALNAVGEVFMKNLSLGCKLSGAVLPLFYVRLDGVIWEGMNCPISREEVIGLLLVV